MWIAGNLSFNFFQQKSPTSIDMNVMEDELLDEDKELANRCADYSIGYAIIYGAFG